MHSPGEGRSRASLPLRGARLRGSSSSERPSLSPASSRPPTKEVNVPLLDSKTLGPTRLGFADEKDLDAFISMLGKFERGEISADAWKQFRLVNGVYSQRQEGDAMMVRVKIPQGVLTPAQLRALADVAEQYSTGRGHITTRQNVQFHFVHLAETDDALRVLADAGLTTREACGNSVRNVTACPYAGASALEPFDTTPYAEAVTRHLLRGPLSASLPRKFKIAFGGCCGYDCVGASFNDIGFLARVRDGKPGFRVTIAGGLSTLRRAGIVAHEFAPAEDAIDRSEEHTSELQSLRHLVCRLLLEKKKQDGLDGEPKRRSMLGPEPLSACGQEALHGAAR